MLKVTFVVAFATFFVGDLSTTYLALMAGHHEANILLKTIGFNGTVFLKILFFIGLFKMTKWLEKKQYQEYGIFVNGAVFANGLLTVMLNIRFFG